MRFIDKITKLSGCQWVSRTFRWSSSMLRQTTHYWRLSNNALLGLSRGPISLDYSISYMPFQECCRHFDSSWPQCTYIHSSEKAPMMWELTSMPSELRVSAFKKNATTDYTLLSKVPNHSQRLTGWLDPFKDYRFPCLTITKHKEGFVREMQKCTQRPGPGHIHITHNLVGPAPSPDTGHHVSAPHQIKPGSKYRNVIASMTPAWAL